MSPLAQKVFESDLAHAFTFPVVVQSPDLVLQCIKGYNPETREIKTVDDKLVAKLDGISIGIIFRLPIRDQVVRIDKEIHH